MSREIKFRAWNTVTEKMMLWDDIKRFGNLNKLISLNHVHVQQFTGILDKNGKEIYEGDIVVWKVNDIVRTAPVYFDELQASFWMGKDKDSGHLVLNDWMRGEHEVIGNIHQNQELL